MDTSNLTVGTAGVGLITEDDSRHQIIRDWYIKILDITKTLDESLITNHPVELDKYL